MTAFACSDRSGGTGGAQLTDVRIAQQSGFDRIKFQVAAGRALPARAPAYKLTTQQSAAFSRDPSGLPLRLDGSAGLAIVFQGTSGFDTTVSPLNQTYRSAQDIRAGLPMLPEAAQVGDLERS